MALPAVTLFCLFLLQVVSPAPLGTFAVPDNLTVGINPHCITDQRFQSPIFNRKDCWSAIKLIDGDAWIHQQERYEFLPPMSSVKGSTKFQSQRTAKKYVAGSCTVAIVALSAFDNGEIPHLPATISSTAVGTYRQAGHWAHEVGWQCLERFEPGPDASLGRLNTESVDFWRLPPIAGWTEKAKRDNSHNFLSQMGYAVTGDDDGLGIFLWATGSTLDRRFVQHQ